MANNSGNVFGAGFPSGIAFVGAIIIGVALGKLLHNMGAYSLLGVGAGFILVALISLLASNKKINR